MKIILRNEKRKIEVVEVDIEKSEEIYIGNVVEMASDDKTMRGEYKIVFIGSMKEYLNRKG